MERYFSQKCIFDMTSDESEIDGYAGKLNVLYLQNVVEQHKCLQFQQEGEGRFLVISPSLDRDYKNRITFFDKKGPISHRDFQNDWKLAQRLNAELGYKQEYMYPEKVMN